MSKAMTAEALAALRAEFEPQQVGKLPKGEKKELAPAACGICGGFHKPCSIHLDYVGHAFVTDRLLAVDPEWVMVPYLLPDGAPCVIEDAARGLAYMPFSMTVCGVTKHEVACASLSAVEWPKLLWSDAITRGAMRFGVALSLWQKEVPITSTDTPPARRAGSARRQAESDSAADRVREVLSAARTLAANLDGDRGPLWEAWKVEHGFDPTRTTPEAADAALAYLKGLHAIMDGAPEPTPADLETDYSS